MGAQGWAAMGKPDFSRAAALVHRLPAELRRQFNKSDQEVLTWTIFLCWHSTYSSGRNHSLASFSETWLGMRFGRSRWTVQRVLAKLERLSLARRIRRAPAKDGTFRTNLIALGAKIRAVLGIQIAQVPDSSPCSKSAPQQVKNLYKGETDPPLRVGSSLSNEKEELWNEQLTVGSVEYNAEWWENLLKRRKASVSPA